MISSQQVTCFSQAFKRHNELAGNLFSVPVGRYIAFSASQSTCTLYFLPRQNNVFSGPRNLVKNLANKNLAQNLVTSQRANIDFTRHLCLNDYNHGREYRLNRQDAFLQFVLRFSWIVVGFSCKNLAKSSQIQHEPKKTYEKKNRLDDYAQNLILVNLIPVNFLGFLVITRYHAMHFRQKLEEIFLSASRTFLNQNFWDQTVGKSKFRDQFFRKTVKV